MRIFFDSSRPLGRLSYFLISLLVAALTARMEAQGPQLTQIVDTLYRPDASAAQGTILIHWPNFTTADGKAVPAGTMSVVIGPSGAISFGLAPNVGATPSGSYYTVVYQLNDGTHSEEYWAVPAAGPTTVGAIRSRIVPQNVAMQVVSRQYVDDQLALKAVDANVVHKSGSETIAGTKSFTAAPSVPSPSAGSDAANKSYVDSQVAAGGSDPNAVHLTGNESISGTKTFTAPPAVPAPAAGGDATNKTYVDAQVATRASDASVVHLTGNESISGTKTFAASPIVPAPTNAGDAATKAYVDSLAGGGGGSPEWVNILNKPTSFPFAGIINGVTDCGAVGNGVTDDYAVLQACLTNNPGRHIILPKRAAAQFAYGLGTNCDYFSSQQLVMSGYGQKLSGATPANDLGGTCIKFPSGSAGIRIPYNCYNCTIENLEVQGSDPWDRTLLTTYEDWRGSEAALLRGPGADGIQALGGEPTLRSVVVVGFKRHCIYLDGRSTIQTPSTPDVWRMDNVSARNCRGNGIYVDGPDANVGVGTRVDARHNALFGVADNSFLGNAWVGLHTASNHNDFAVAGATQALSSCSVASNVITCTTAGALANGINVVGTWVTASGQADSSFDGTWKVTAFNAGAQTVTGTFTHANGSTSGGSIGKAATASVYNTWSAQGIDGGCVGGGSALSTYQYLYTESGQGINNKCVKLANGTMILGSNGGPLGFQDTATQPMWVTTGGFFAPSVTFRDLRDNQFSIGLQAGTNSRQFTAIKFFDHLGVQKHTIEMSSTNFFGIKEGATYWISKTEGGSVSLQNSTFTVNTAGQLTAGNVPWARLTSVPATFTPSAHTHVKADVTDFGTYEAPLTFNAPLARVGNTISCSGCGGPAAWGAITGTLSSQTDLQAVLDGKAASAHTHADADIPNNITIDLATLAITATTANAGDSATAFFPSGTLEDGRLSANVSLLGQTIGGAELSNPAVGTKGGVEAKACSGTDKLSAIGTDGVPVCSADQTSAGGGITTLNTLTDAIQTLSKVDDANVTLAITSAAANHQFALGWTGTLAKARQNVATIYGDASNTYSGTSTQDFGAATITFKLPKKTDPGSPAAGECWINSADLKCRDNQGAPATQTFERQANKNAASGYAGLDSGARIAKAQAPIDATYTVAGGTAALATGALGAGACATAVTVSATGVATTDVIQWTPNADLSAVTGYTPDGTLRIYPYPTANNVNFKVCNGGSTAVTPGAVTLNWRVVR
jgi:hypothetical protein